MLRMPQMGIQTGDEILDLKIIQYQNDIVDDMFDLIIDGLESNGWNKEDLEYYFPRNYIEDHLDMARRVILDLRDVINSPVGRRVLKPLYEYVLYEVLDEYIQLNKELYGNTIRKLPNDLKKKIIVTMEKHDRSKNEIKEAIDYLEDLSYLYDDLFWDYDFKQDVVDMVGLGYLEDNRIDKMMGIDIDQYIDIMSSDIKEDYLRKKKYQSEINIDDEKFIIQEIFSAIKILEKRALEIENFSEVQICNYIDAMLIRIMYLKNRIIVSREEPIGYSKIKLGEADFFLYRQEEQYDNIAIVECKFINKSMKEIGQLIGYLNHNFKFGVTITINKNMSLEKSREVIINGLQNIKNDEIINITKVYPSDKYNNLYISEHHIYGETNKEMKIYHFILNLYNKNRKEIAKAVR